MDVNYFTSIRPVCEHWTHDIDDLRETKETIKKLRNRISNRLLPINNRLLIIYLIIIL